MLLTRLMTPTEIAKTFGVETTTLNVLLGVVLGSVLALIPFVLNLIYDAYQKRRERRTVVKRDAFLKALEGAAMMGEFVASYISGDVTWVDTVKVAPGWMHKLHLVAGDDTIRAFMEVSDFLMEAVAELTQIRADIDQNELEYDLAGKWRENMIEFQKRNEEKPVPVAETDALKAKLELLVKISDGFERQKVLLRKRDELNSHLAERVFGLYVKYDELLMKGVIELRRELGFGEGSKQYQQILAQSSEKTRATFNKSIHAIEAKRLFKDDERVTEDRGQAGPRSSSSAAITADRPQR